ncbi:Pre-mRNA-splicing factor cwc24 [Drechmeria coniospora]|uniref:Pre-mRNA-splicing factor cwc24 n=1 Tax=Drechmeria coniospora TaxID=98403 RepID=A0A151GV77_DRECN|nr:Pre-mRNA-splicing factor cwc24 [Drechmeria coniospora]KYK61016.1 Pre-mRNA-splicing factor cwc24 [Drechmeria coniospora]ODA83312.1 hypothetical protein RJ55_01825 [Drechmeria coniospora]
MSLPTTKAPPPAAQSSIRSFFQTQGPKYVSPPSTLPRPQEQEKDATSSKDASSSNSPARTPLPSVDEPIPPPPENMPREASIRTMTSADVNALRRINALLLPIAYPDSFYLRAVNPAESGRFSRVITWAHDGEEPKVVGGVVCRVEPALLNRQRPGPVGDSQQVPHNLYIQSLCLLSPFRKMGLINAALENVVATAVTDPKLNVRTVTAHVWTENEEALLWYEGRGFRRQEPPVQAYYPKLRPSTAWLVHRDAGASVLSSLPQPSPPLSARSVMPSTTVDVVNLPSPPASAPPLQSNFLAPAPPRGPTRGKSYQNQRAATEWNDLPSDMTPRSRSLVRKMGSEPLLDVTSKVSAAPRKKRDRSYPAAAFHT